MRLPSPIAVSPPRIVAFRVDDDVVADRRMALGTRHVLLHARRPERDALAELDARAQHGGFADDDARAVIDGERRTDARGRMDVDAGVAVRGLGQHAWHQRHFAALQLVREPVDGGGEASGVGEDHLVDGVRGGIAVVDRLGVDQQRRADVRQGGEEALDDIVGVRAVRLGQPQRVGQQRAQRGQLVGDVAGTAAHLGGEVREQQL
jgi:hypothetical protein